MSDNGTDHSFNDGSSSDLTTNPPWPNVRRVDQAQIEKKYFQDGATIHFERLPGLPSWTRLFFVKDTLRVFYVTNKTIQASKLSRRRLAPEEVDATSEAAAHASRWLALINPTSLLITGAICWRTRKTFKFPLYQPNQTIFNPYTFPSRRFPIVKDSSAVYAWHGIRFLCYFPLTMIVSTVFYSSIAEKSYDIRILKDPRMKAWVEDVRRNLVNQSRMQHGNQGPQQNLPAHPDPNSQSSQGFSAPPSPHDKYSFESGNQASREYERDSFTSQSNSSSSDSDAEDRRSSSASSPESYWGKGTQFQGSDSGSRHSDDDSDLFDDADDASPVPAALRRAEAQQTRNAQAGSAWDRIRQQTQSGNAQWARGDSSGEESGWGQLRQDKTKNPQERQPRTEGFAYTMQDEDKEGKNYEQDKAQKEFDAFLESERRGGSQRR
ncbi:uncharacterized protein F4812DRAFT_409921 [Daldinia caldariorum]|uniref:uncharacterized protein n=1 Tax=Daldinia caldariorum TaxID=326644 RepID=UPI00200783DF|nr:uncharacterized protein F4812DRAFT_409921 [Daldinia caldariorum]KAI1472693.1 hypothetical protein F4812DRAFT_409921 [Daldinia caldariorum]